MLTDNDIAEFQRLYKARFGKEISKEDAYEQGIKLITLMKIIYKPVTEEQHRTAQDEIVRGRVEYLKEKFGIQDSKNE